MINETTTIQARRISDEVETAVVEIKKTFILTPRHINIIHEMIANQSKYGSEHAWSEFRQRDDYDNGREYDMLACEEMAEMGLTAQEEMAWHRTYYVTDLGEEVIKKLNLRSSPVKFILPSGLVINEAKAAKPNDKRVWSAEEIADAEQED